MQPAGLRVKKPTRVRPQFCVYHVLLIFIRVNKVGSNPTDPK